MTKLGLLLFAPPVFPFAGACSPWLLPSPRILRRSPPVDPRAPRQRLAVPSTRRPLQWIRHPSTREPLASASLAVPPLAAPSSGSGIPSTREPLAAPHSPAPPLASASTRRPLHSPAPPLAIPLPAAEVEGPPEILHSSSNRRHSRFIFPRCRGRSTVAPYSIVD